MRDFDPAAAFGPAVSAWYDQTPRGDETVAVDLLAELSHGESALEFAIGTGRIALPLAERGVRVDGIELSTDMVDQLRAKPGGSELDVVVGDMAATTTGRTYPLVYLVFNTIFNLLTQDNQVRCFENAARHLTDDGVFLVEAAVPSAWLPSNQYVNAEQVESSYVVLDVCRYDPATQILDENHVRLDTGGVRLSPISCRLAWPSELDLMARLAGLELVDRWGGWEKERYTGEGKHVSVYGRR
ncbi:SAM-dependent methyltransferase [Kribbella sp. ALI-6-A]|uniref:class I SAM-dependent DNA methyltransferase n=1 Tax=Kribbella sp. ALI-6-A TaxID=1933817 RepID=UPI00097BDD82|nr:class I SAM-dependent methyltransferase [Kribbella sp. ALI-6-A]ONI69434.1 SAM-dependent methyltransferase [Kribbella sp. ALI-6-A]